TTAQITLRVQSTQTRAPCPLCATPARRIHSDYGRTLADLPWAQYRVHLQLRVRKWFCGNRTCRRRIFTERLPTVAGPLGAPHPAAGPAPRGSWHGAGGYGRGAPRPRVGPGYEPEHPAAHHPPRATARLAYAAGAGGGRFRPAQTPHVWNGAHRSGAPAACRPAPGPRG